MPPWHVLVELYECIRAHFDAKFLLVSTARQRLISVFVSQLQLQCTSFFKDLLFKPQFSRGNPLKLVKNSCSGGAATMQGQLPGCC